MRRFLLLAITCAVVAVVAIIGLALREPDTISFHLNHLLQLQNPANRLPPVDFKNYFRLDTLSWYLRGRPSREKQIERETRALIRLGYFGQRDIALQHRLLDKQFIEEFRAVCQTNESVRTTYRAFAYDQPANVIRITIRKDHLPACEKIITELDRHVK